MLTHMLSQPKDGWTDFQLDSENTAYCLSFLTDPAIEWLDQTIHGLETMDVFSVHGFCEPGRMVCTVSYWNCYVIFEGDGKEDHCESVYTVHVSMIDFCRKLHADITDNLDAWVHWDDGRTEAILEEGEGYNSPAFQQSIEKRRTLIQSKLDTLKQLINEKAENFEKHWLI